MTTSLPFNAPQTFGIAQPDRIRVGPFAAWRNMFAGIFDVDAAPQEISSFEGDIAAWSTKRFVLSETRSSRIHLLRSPNAGTRPLEHFAIKLVLSGSIAGVAGSKVVEAESGDILFLDLSQSLNILISGRGGMTSDITLWVPRARLLASVSNDHELHGFVVRGTSPAGALVGASLRTLVEQINRMTINDLDALADGTIELNAHAIAPLFERTAATDPANPLTSFVTIRRFIERNLTSPDLDIDMIAESFGLSRASLYRLFQPLGGIAGYIRKRRLDLAYQEVTASELANLRIGPIAYRLGFKNVSAFNRAFRGTYGVSPSEARANTLKGVTKASRRADFSDGNSLRHWLTKIAEVHETTQRSSLSTSCV
jgi:AraC-like DNA-binding protein